MSLETKDSVLFTAILSVDSALKHKYLLVGKMLLYIPLLRCHVSKAGIMNRLRKERTRCW